METENHLKSEPAAQVIVEVGANSLQAQVKAGTHRLIVDEPKKLGGTDTGPKPEDLLLSALGSCTAITLRMYADRKTWPLEKIEVHVDFGNVGQDVSQRKIGMQIYVHGNLNQEQTDRLKEIAGKCPVHKSLSPAFDIGIELALAAPEFQ